MAGPAYRSPWGKNVGGASKPPAPTGPGKQSFVAPWFGGAKEPTEPPVFIQAGDRSPLFFWGGGAAKPTSHGDYAGPCSMLAFWIGGARGYTYAGRPPEPERIIGPDGPSFLRHHERGRPIVDDDEILDFLRLWTVWNDIE